MMISLCRENGCKIITDLKESTYARQGMHIEKAFMMRVVENAVI